MAMASMSSLAATAVKSSVASSVSGMRERRADQMSQVDWEDYNYPPWINVLHYSLKDVEDPGAKTAVKWAHYNYIMGVTTFALNVLSMLVLAAGGVKWKGVHLIYAIFNLIIYGIVGMYSFYNGFKGLATQNGRMTTNFVGLQSLFLVFMFAASIASGANYNGWTNLAIAADVEKSKKMRGFWVGWTYFEASLWTLDYIVGGFALYKVVTSRNDGRSSKAGGPLLRNIGI
uniref:Secretory carrier-associated membrane protein n=1 Tax=Mantoniella antarctica TaxID=81844 RepID=A0A7S0SS67_9CHLO|mmetsp:Transcript_30436/g.49069  ORF Transcript_30436/g.49069 Transcript_30436/m.49069 type:complete len:230 (-) Transcript_30436:44-733(-)